MYNCVYQYTQCKRDSIYSHVPVLRKDNSKVLVVHAHVIATSGVHTIYPPSTTQYAYGATPLFVASEEGYTDIVDLLLRAGADVHQARKVCIKAHYPR